MMYTQCHQCHTVFEIDAADLREARGRVRCGRCGEVFDALAALADEWPGAGDIPTTVFSDRPPTLQQADADDDALDLLTGNTPPIEFDVVEETELEPTPIRPRPLHDPSATGRIHAAAWAAGSVLLFLVLVVQVAWGERQELLNSPTVRPWLDRICAELGCSLPLRRDLDQVRLISRDIRPHPSVEGALIINATLRNTADFAQPYPEVVIELADLDGDPVAARSFEPAEYLDEGTAVAQGMAPGTLLPLVFEVVDPGEDAVAFEFSFR